MRHSEDWASAVLRELRWDPNDTQTNVHVELLDGRLVLTGVVDSVAMREAAGQAAARIAAQLDGAPQVENDITVVAVREVSDRTLQQKVNEVLAAVPGLAPEAVGARVDRGIAFLEGRVPSAVEVELAMAAARRVPGLKDVVSHIQITIGRPLDPVGLVNQVTDALGPQLRANALRLRVEADPDGTVRLAGEAETEEERNRAERVALGVSGVHRVVNQIRTIPK